jgi:hypothetical protein
MIKDDRTYPHSYLLKPGIEYAPYGTSFFYTLCWVIAATSKTTHQTGFNLLPVRTDKTQYL